MECRFIKYNRYFSNKTDAKEALKAFIEQEWPKIVAFKKGNDGKTFRTKNKERCKKLLEHILVDLIKTRAENTEDEAYLSISLKKNWYSKHKNASPKHLTYENMVLIHKYLKQQNLIGEIPAQWVGSNNEDNRTTRIKASEKLMKAILGDSYDSKLYYWLNTDVDFKSSPQIKIAIWEKKEVKDKQSPDKTKEKKERKFIEPRPDQLEQFEEMEKPVLKINNHFKKVNIDIAITDQQEEELKQQYNRSENNDLRNISFNLDQKYLYRTFSRGELNKGGRFYGPWWQAIPKKLRQYITIEGEFTVEVDYSSLHPSLLYIKETGEASKQDPYLTQSILAEQDEKLRKTYRASSKRLFNAILNAPDKRIGNEPEKDEFGRWHQDGEGNWVKEYKFPQGMDLKAMRQELEELHEPIKKHFYNDSGVALQFMDSEIAQNVMLKAIAENITVLPVHDSFIVQTQHTDRLYELMKKAIIKLCKNHFDREIKDFKMASERTHTFNVKNNNYIKINIFDRTGEEIKGNDAQAVYNEQKRQFIDKRKRYFLRNPEYKNKDVITGAITSKDFTIELGLTV